MMPTNLNNDVLCGAFGVVTMSLYLRFATLTGREEQVLTNTFLTRLTELDDDSFVARENLDTDHAVAGKHT